MQKLTYIVLFVLGLFSIVGMFRPNHEVTSQQSSVTTVSRSAEFNAVEANALLWFDVEDEENNNESTLANVLVETDYHCNELCKEGLEWLNLQDGLTDEEFEKAISRSSELAEYLKKNPAVVSDFLELANTDDGDKRSVLMQVFNQLDFDTRILLGDVFIESTDFRNRYDGVKFLAKPDIIHEPLTQRFSEMLAVESNQLVRNALIKAFNQPEKFYADEQVLDILEQVSNEEVDSVIRGEALLARIQLEEDPEQVFLDSVAAVRSDTEEYQIYGLQALEQIAMRQAFDEVELSQEVKEEARYLFEELRNYGYDDAPIRFLSEANDIYVRHFSH